MAEPRTKETDARSEVCCAADPRIAKHFDQRIVEQTSDAQGDFPSMADVSAGLLRLVESEVAATAPSVLELGCGSGALTVALLKRGAARARGLDLSPGMVSVAVRRAEAAGVADRAAFGVGDAALERHEPADLVVLDRVICCYPDMDGLLRNAMSAARSGIALTVPTSRGWRGWLNRVLWRLENVPLRFGRPGCPTYVHSLDRIESVLRAGGLRERSWAPVGLWHAALWERAA